MGGRGPRLPCGAHRTDRADGFAHETPNNGLGITCLRDHGANVHRLCLDDLSSVTSDRCKQIVRLHKGRVKANQRLDQLRVDPGFRLVATPELKQVRRHA